MNIAIDIKKLYLIAILFIASCIVAIAFEFYVFLALPLVLALGYTLIIKPKYIFYFLAFCTPLSVHLLEERWSTINLSMPTEPLIILLLIGVFVKLLHTKKISFKELNVFLSVLLLADLGWMLVTSITSSMPLISLKYLLSKTWYLVIFYFLAIRYFRSERTIKVFLWSFIMAVVILAAYTLYNHSLGSFSRGYAYTAMRPFLPDHGMYAACISFVAPLLFVFALHGQKIKYSIPFRLICFGLFLFIAVAVALSFTRASWVSLVASLGIYIAIRFGIQLKHLILITIIGVSGLMANMDNLLTDLSRNKNESDDNIENHLQSVSNVSSDPSNLERLNRWGCAIRMWEEKPMLGFGPGTYTFQYGQFQLPHEMTIISTNTGRLGGVHSEYLRPLSESGFLGALFWVLIVLGVIVLGFKQSRTLTGSAKYLSLAVFLGLVTYFVHGVLNNYSDFDKIAVPLYSFMAVMTALELNYLNDKEDSKE
ncbi:MAG: O-antigen ligase family protein [Bacteroidia bacterium]|nr:O-antigen ligase family protein [Bacteroidia bacterium]